MLRSMFLDLIIEVTQYGCILSIIVSKNANILFIFKTGSFKNVEYSAQCKFVVFCKVMLMFGD